MVQNLGLIFKKVPVASPIVGEHIDIESRDFDADTEAPEGGVTVKNIYLSFDPYQRGCMREPDNGTYSYPFVPGQPLVCGAVSEILKSSTPSFKPGDLVWGMFGAEEYSVVPPMLIPMVRKLDNPLALDPILFAGPLGISGLSAYASFYEIGKPKKGQTIFISAASGGVGQIVGQLAKLEGLTVVGSVGSDEKLNFILNELSFDAGFNYKKENVSDALKRLVPSGIDIYYDNVGGETLDAALGAMKDFGRIVGCGQISQYNLPQDEKYGIKNMMNLFLKRLTLQGFIISDPEFMGKYAVEFFTKMSAWLKEGKIKTKESVTVGIENAATCYLGMFTGENFGKTVLKVANME
ncbi:NAD(P)-binding protein [Lindgomyces ingoldianus]|uniref:NAD(P)-binding protein n=1 Tax=Lindgomyces ingoldianus TaxID=673940 RepID=A0ACB6R7K0_9PLEO|nr:NAD(P)-binding protein [Lindgomyces ingoldianus]KAF2475279.1 NAD(P)-binding protein [Lindgomyces ingoldianus]